MWLPRSTYIETCGILLLGGRDIVLSTYLAMQDSEPFLLQTPTNYPQLQLRYRFQNV